MYACMHILVILHCRTIQPFTTGLWGDRLLMSDKEAKRLRRQIRWFLSCSAWETMWKSHRFWIISRGKSSTIGVVVHIIYDSLLEDNTKRLFKHKRNIGTMSPNLSKYIDKGHIIICNHQPNQLEINIICYRVSNIGYVSVTPIIGWLKARPQKQRHHHTWCFLEG
jgi:hypothetical protein